MRARYSAYATQNNPYILSTMSGKALNDFTGFSSQSDTITWVKLEICNTGKYNDMSAWVEFKAFYIGSNGKMGQMHEKSDFNFENNQWFYVNGQIY